MEINKAEAQLKKDKAKLAGLWKAYKHTLDGVDYDNLLRFRKLLYKRYPKSHHSSNAIGFIKIVTTKTKT